MGQKMQNDSGFTPNGDLVLILPLGVDEFSKGGIAMPQTIREKQGRAARVGTVIDFGDVAAEHPRMKNIQRGDMVLFPRYAGDEWPVDGKMYLIMQAISINGKVTKLPDYLMNPAIPSLEAFGGNMTIEAA